MCVNLLTPQEFNDGTGEKLHAIGALEMNAAILHSTAVLYLHTKDASHLALCHTVLASLQIAPAGDHPGC